MAVSYKAGDAETSASMKQQHAIAGISKWTLASSGAVAQSLAMVLAINRFQGKICSLVSGDWLKTGLMEVGVKVFLVKAQIAVLAQSCISDSHVMESAMISTEVLWTSTEIMFLVPIRIIRTISANASEQLTKMTTFSPVSIELMRIHFPQPMSMKPPWMLLILMNFSQAVLLKEKAHFKELLVCYVQAST